jgi:hypothetical protein
MRTIGCLRVPGSSLKRSRASAPWVRQEEDDVTCAKLLPAQRFLRPFPWRRNGHGPGGNDLMELSFGRSFICADAHIRLRAARRSPERYPGIRSRSDIRPHCL